jgi:putative nucleotidyltransferase with HDIG domain
MALVQGIAGLLFLVSLAWAATAGGGSFLGPTVLVFVAIACLFEALAVSFSTRYVITGWDWCYLGAIFFVGHGAGVVVAVSATLVGWAIKRYRPTALLVNLGALTAPIVVGTVLFDLLDGRIGFMPATAVATVAVMSLHLVLVFPLIGLMDGVPMRETAGRLRAVAGPLAFQAIFAVTIADVYREYGTAMMAVALVFGGAFVYMARLVVLARERATAHADLSWGVLSGLIRTLEIRDPRAARHCAAVARFSRDIARQAGLNKADQQLAHTAGLLHDIGKFALSDRVLNGEGLTADDWRGIRRHPAVGADLLRDISLYGPVGDIVGAHHERIDGRGYPNRLAGEDIPEIARIVAVAEVYDTLTAPDTYRTPTTSFEALTILRGAAGRQFDGRFVEALALVLAGQDLAYRHAGDADFDRELDIERRVSDAART